MARAPVADIRVTEALRPQAEPVDTYVRPAAPSRSPLWDVAEALGKADNQLASWLQGEDAKAKEQDRLRGEAQFYRDNQLGYAEAVRSGKIPSYASPGFVEGYKAAQGSAMGFDLEQRFAQEYANWSGKTSEDPKAFDTFFSGFLKENIGSDDPEVLRGLLPHVRQMASSWHDKYVTDRANATYSGAVEANGALAGRSIDSAEQEGLRQPTGTDYDQLWATLTTIRQRAFQSGMTEEDADKSIIQAITAKAIEHRDPNILGLLDKNLPGKDYAISDSPYGRTIKAQAIEQLKGIARQQLQDEASQQAAREKEAKGYYERSMIERLAADPKAPLDDAFLKEGSLWIPDFRLKAIAAQKAMLEAGGAEDPEKLLQLNTDILTGGGTAAIMKALGDGTIRSSESLAKAFSMVKSYEDYAQGDQKVLETQSFKTLVDTIKQRTAPQGDVNPYADTASMTPAGMQARNDAIMMVLQWQQQHPNATPMEREKALGEISQVILSHITPPAGSERDPSAMPTYERPKEATAVQPQATFTDNQPAQAGGPPKAPDWVKTMLAAPQPPPLESFTPEQRTAIEQRAAARGMDPKVYAETMWSILQEERAKADGKLMSEPPPGMGPSDPPGMVEPGNIDLNNRPRVQNGDGSISTVRSMSFEEDGVEVLIPTVAADGSRILSDQEAIDQYHRTGQFLGKFESPEAATAYAKKLHDAQAKMLGDPQQPESIVGTPPQRMSYSPEDQAAKAIEAIFQPVLDPPLQERTMVPTKRANFMTVSNAGNPTSAGWESKNLVSIQSPVGPVKVHKLAAPAFEGFLRELDSMGYHFKSVGGHVIRPIRGRSSGYSQHAFGNAIDINPDDNPLGSSTNNLPPNIAEIAAKWHLNWGGLWKGRKDPMHFEWNGVPLQQSLTA